MGCRLRFGGSASGRSTHRRGQDSDSSHSCIDRRRHGRRRSRRVDNASQSITKRTSRRCQGPGCQDSSRSEGRNAGTCPGRKDRGCRVRSDTRQAWTPPPHLNRRARLCRSIYPGQSELDPDRSFGSGELSSDQRWRLCVRRRPRVGRLLVATSSRVLRSSACRGAMVLLAIRKGAT